MGAVKRYIEERDEIVYRLEEIRDSFKGYELYTRLEILIKSLDSGTLFPQTLLFVSSEISEWGQLASEFENKDSDRKDIIEAQLSIPVRQALDILRNEATDTPLNTVSYYETKIKQLEKEKDILTKKIRSLNQTIGEKEAVNKDAEEEIKKLYATLISLDKERSQFEASKNKAERLLDMQNNLAEKIKTAFNELSSHNKPLEDELRRLNLLFWLYLVGTIIVVICLLLYEYKVIASFHVPNKWIDYLPIYLPIPLCAGLMWTFIYQMNRAQRQLIVLSNKIHQIKYVEGLLLAINQLTSDSAESQKQMRDVMNRIIDTYQDMHKYGMSEDTIRKEIGKDNISLHQIERLLKGIKGLVK